MELTTLLVMALSAVMLAVAIAVSISSLRRERRIRKVRADIQRLLVPVPDETEEPEEPVNIYAVDAPGFRYTL